MKSQQLLDSFVAYCKANPDQRFWQALRNWCGWSFVLVSNDRLCTEEASVVDTFYWEHNKDAPK